MEVSEKKHELFSNSQHFRTFSALPFAERAVLASRMMNTARPIETMEFSLLAQKKDAVIHSYSRHTRVDSLAELVPKTTANEATKPIPKSFRFKLTVLFLCLVTFVTAMDAAMVAACLPVIMRSLRCTTSQAFWIGTALFLSQTVAIPIFAATSERLRRKWTLITAVALYSIGIILCATARDVYWLIGARVVQGVGAGGVVQVVQAVLSDITAPCERLKYDTILTCAWASGTIIGIPVGGVIGAYIPWSWIFWLQLLCSTICIPGLSLSLPSKQDISYVSTKITRFDYLGLLIFTAACTLFLVGVTSGNSPASWATPMGLSMLGVGVTLFIAFVVVEWKVVEEPMISKDIYSDRTAIAGLSSSLLQGLLTWCLIYALIIFFLGALRQSLLSSANSTLPFVACLALSAVTTPSIINYFHHFKYIMIFGWVLLTAGLCLNLIIYTNSSQLLIYGPRCVAGIGAGILIPSPLFAVQAHQKENDIKLATTMNSSMKTLGQALGVAICGAIFQNQWSALSSTLIREGKIPDRFVLRDSLADLVSGTMKKMPQDIRTVYGGLYVDSLRPVWWFTVAIGIVGLALASIARNDEVRRPRVEREIIEDEGDDDVEAVSLARQLEDEREEPEHEKRQEMERVQAREEARKRHDVEEKEEDAERQDIEEARSVREKEHGYVKQKVVEIERQQENQRAVSTGKADHAERTDEANKEEKPVVNFKAMLEMKEGQEEDGGRQVHMHGVDFTL